MRSLKTWGSHLGGIPIDSAGISHSGDENFPYVKFPLKKLHDQNNPFPATQQDFLSDIESESGMKVG